MASNKEQKNLISTKEIFKKSAYDILNDLTKSWFDSHQDTTNAVSRGKHNEIKCPSNKETCSNVVSTNLEIAKNTLATSGSQIMQSLSSSLTMISEEVKSSGASATKGATDTFQNWTQGVKQQVSSPWMNEAINQVSTIYDQLKSKSDHHLMKSPILLSLLQKLREIEKQRIKKVINLDPVPFHKTHIEGLKRFGEIALNMQPIANSDELTIAGILNIRQQDILTSWFHDDISDVHCPKFIIFMDHGTKSIVLAIRGTYSVRDAVMDIVSDSVPFLEGWAHRGILDGAMKILQEAEDVFKEALIQNSNYSIVVTGHSLGGGAAQLITLEMIYGFWKERIGIPNDTIVNCYAFGAPPVFTSAETIVPKEVPHIHLLVNQSDVVPTLSLASVGKVLAQMSALESLKLTFYEKAQIILQSNSLMNRNTFTAMVSEISKRYERLLLYSGETKTSLVAMSQSMLQSITSLSKKEADTIRSENNKLIYATNKRNFKGIVGSECENEKTTVRTKNHKSKAESQVGLLANRVSTSENENSEINVIDIAKTKEISKATMGDNTAKALKTINTIKFDPSSVFLNHPGIVYQIYMKERKGANTFGVIRLAYDEKSRLSQNVELDVTNMITNHFPIEYCKVLGKIS